MNLQELDQFISTILCDNEFHSFTYSVEFGMVVSLHVDGLLIVHNGVRLQ